MKDTTHLLLICAALLSGCTNYMYQGQLTAPDASGRERHYILYWPKTEQLLGTTKAGPAVLLTECSPTRIDFDDQPQGIIFRGEQGRDRLPGSATSVNRGQVCGKILGYSKLADIPTGDIQLEIDCAPISDELSLQPRNYLQARPAPYVVRVVEKEKQWSMLGSTLPGPVLNCQKSSKQ